MSYLDHPSVEAPHIPNKFSPKMTHQIHVLLVEHENIDHDIYKKMLEYFSGQVTTVRLASTAVSYLLKGKVRYDLVMGNLNSPDSCGLHLVDVAMQMNVLLILMSNIDDDITNMRVFEARGVYCIKKPVTMQTMSYLWQLCVVRKKGDGDMLQQNVEQPMEFIEYMIPPAQEFVEQDYNNIMEGYNQNDKTGDDNNNVSFQTKVWVEWTPELHQKFMYVARFLGQGRCFPSAITELMNVPGLSRMQVASHLQRCRKAKWLPPSKKRSILANGWAETSKPPPKKKGRPRSKTLFFGSMPRLVANKYKTMINCEEEVVVVNNPPPPLITDGEGSYSINDVGATSQYPQYSETGQLGLMFNGDDDDNGDVVFHDLPDLDLMIQNVSDSGLMDFDGTLEPLVLDQPDINNSFVPLESTWTY